MKLNWNFHRGGWGEGGGEGGGGCGGGRGTNQIAILGGGTTV